MLQKRQFSCMDESPLWNCWIPINLGINCLKSWGVQRGSGFSQKGWVMHCSFIGFAADYDEVIISL